MKKKALRGLTLLVMQCFVLIVSAQTKSAISGTINDSATQKPLQYVTIEIHKGGAITPQALKATFTNDKGAFRLTGIDTGSYIILVTHTGFAEKQQAVIVTAGEAVDLKTISLSPSAGALKGIVVTARKPLVEQQDDKIIFNVENDPATKTETAIDILRKTPFVSVDGDNNVTVNGQTNFKVLLNGRETGMFAQNPKEALKGFPGSVITKIEVITSPSAKYDAEGVGGIINIITRKKVVGYNGSVNLWANQIGWYNLNTNFSAKFGKWGMTMYYGLNGGNNIPGKSRMITQPQVPANFKRRELNGSRTMNNLWQFGNAEISYEKDSLNTFAFYGNISGGRNRHILDQTITTSYPNGIDSISYYDLNSDYKMPTTSVGADYIKKFSGNKEKEFSIRTNAEFGISNTFLNSVMDNPVMNDRYVINNSEATNKQYTVQSDYILPLKNNQKLETGVKAIIRKAASDFEGRIKTTNAEEYQLNVNNTDRFRYDQNVFGAYSSYSFKKDKTTFRLGARLEHTTVDGNFISSKTRVNQSYTNVLPNLQATTKFSNSFTTVITYSDRIQRPFIQNLNPFRNDNDPRFITYGNPNLQPQTIHSLAVQTRLMKGRTFAGITFTGSYSDNLIVQYSSFDAPKGITSTTSDNVGKEWSFSAQGNFNTKLNNDWSVFLNGNVRYNRVENKFLKGQVNSGISGNANLNTSYSISKKFTMSGYGGFFRAPVTIQTSYPLNLWYGIHAGYKLFNEKLTVSGGISNFFEKERAWELRTIDPAFEYVSTTTSPFRALSFSITWNFGKLTESVSKKKGVTNDDQLSSGQSN
ncbi:MAG TPA: outer membrane beta-barrel protein [Flavisolibacter sp.]|nr:outer membrane beta-barrel protein [Flavisolibacter sp.]